MAKNKSPADRLVAAVTPPPTGPYVGKKMYGRKGTKDARVAGTITGTSECRQAGCRGLYLHVKWPDGTRTYPCTKGCTQRPGGDWEVG